VKWTGLIIPTHGSDQNRVTDPVGSRTCRPSLPRTHLLHAADDPTAPLRKPDCIQPQTLSAVARGSGAGSLAISTPDGVKAIDVAWRAPERGQEADTETYLTRAPEICVEILSPSNTAGEIDEKIALYFEAGGHVRFGSASETELSSSTSPARQRYANRPGFARSFRHSLAS
jgi:hypothetical protein